MARTAFSYISLAVNTQSLTDIVATAIDASNGMTITGGAKVKSGRLALVYTNTTASASKALTVVAGKDFANGGPAFEAGILLAVPNSVGKLFGNMTTTAGLCFCVLDTSFFAQANQDIYLNFTSGTTGTITAYEIA